LIITLAVIAVLVVVGVGSYVGLALVRSNTDYSVGSCVKPQGGDVAVVECSEADAFEIVASVSSVTECQDASQPWLEVREITGGTSYRCLAPAAG
jgi:hypothetical protein